MEQESKVCTKCGQMKPLEEFNRRKASKGGRNSKCRACTRTENAYFNSIRVDKKREYDKKRYSDPAFAERMKVNVRIWQKANPEKVKANNQRSMDKKRGIKPGFTGEQWLQLCAEYGNCCCCCGELKPLTADHVIPQSKGGDSDISNIQPLCLSCNSSKKGQMIDYRHAAKQRLSLQKPTTGP